MVEMADSPNARAAAATVQALRDAGRLTPADDALIAAVEALSLAVDADPGNAALWREYRSMLVELRSCGADEGSGSDIDDLIAALRGDATVGDGQDAKPGHARRGSRSGR